MTPRFTIDQSSLLVVDVQGRLVEMMHEKQRLFEQISIMIQAAHILNMPIHWFEQYPKGLGPTKPEIKDLLVDDAYHEKITFSGYGAESFKQALLVSGRPQCVLTGIETHVCVYQTALDLLAAGYAVKVNQDAVSSRRESNKQLALSNLHEAGAEITTTEMILFELMQTAEHPKFREISRLLK